MAAEEENSDITQNAGSSSVEEAGDNITELNEGGAVQTVTAPNVHVENGTEASPSNEAISETNHNPEGGSIESPPTLTSSEEISNTEELVKDDSGDSLTNQTTVSTMDAPPPQSDSTIITPQDNSKQSGIAVSGQNNGANSDVSAGVPEPPRPPPPSKSNYDTATKTTNTGSQRIPNKAAISQSSVDDDTSPPCLLSLNIDSLHSVASFLSAVDWDSFGQCCKGSNRVCREIFRRVRMHGFRCATEVVTAWKLGQHADARELCALYINSGVPIYPYSLGHSYHTLVWRMGVEERETRRLSEQRSESPGGDDGTGTGTSNPSTRTDVDRFSTERHETRAREGYSSTFTYLEEKSIFLIEADAETNQTRDLAQTIRRQFMLNPAAPFLRHPHHFATDDPIRLSLARSTTVGVPMQESSADGPARRRYSNSYLEPSMKSPKVSVSVHRHLLDQHLLGRPCVNDNDGTMITAPVNLSVDFFHPHFSLGHKHPEKNNAHTPTTGHTAFGPNSSHVTGGELLPAWSNQSIPPGLAVGLGGLVGTTSSNNNENIPGALRHDVGVFGDDSDSESETAVRRTQPTADTVFEPQAAEGALGQAERIPTADPQIVENTTPFHQASSPSFNVLSSIELEVYNSLSMNSKAALDRYDSREMRNHLATRFGVYQRRLEALVAHGDNVGFEECILDFWDEFLPQTANIHYYDRSTPVPRITSLHKFLTKPCPKAIGIVQCEIERIKLNPKKNRVNMKERFFPKYEYRLFIRHTPPDSSDNESRPRRDTVLMMAKNKGRKHVEASAPPQGKKGANNYYLYMPRQDDVEHHYELVNEVETVPHPVPNGATMSPPSRDGSVLLGRLQSNFIGTEFQIFTPQLRKPGNPKDLARSLTTPIGSAALSSDDEFGYDSGMSSDNASSSSRRRGRFGRLSLRRNSTEQSTIVEGQSLESSRFSNRTIRRSRSSGDLTGTHNRLGRTSRRAIANTGTASTAETAEPQRLVLCEEEDGAITYTANLLGSRPRIMDVCIPKVAAEGLAGGEWRKYLENCVANDESSSSRMLNHLKQIQSRMENEDQGRVADHVGAGVPATGNTNSGDYSPPDDFGLLALQNRPPWWNIELGSFVLNFGGRVSVASVKNFQLCDRADQDYIMLQFGRIQGRHSFTMDFQHPLTAVQAFAIAISSLQSKISLS